MQVVFTGDDPGLATAAEFVTALWLREEFWTAIEQRGSFDRATIPAAAIVARLRPSRATYTVKLWTPTPDAKDSYRNTVALTDTDYPFTLFYHDRFLGNPPEAKVNTIVHEFIHNIDNTDGDPGEQMGHGDNDWHGKQDTAPYWIGMLAEKLFTKAHPAVVRTLFGKVPEMRPCARGQGSAGDGEILAG